MTKTFAVVTTFNSKLWDSYAKDCLASAVKHLSDDVVLMCQLDEVDPKRQELTKVVIDATRSGIDFICNTYSAEQKAFLERHKDFKKPDNVPAGTKYRYDYVRFSHKVFAIARAALEIEADYLVWMDADVTTHATPDFNTLVREGSIVSYLGRTDWNCSETGLIIFDLKNGGIPFIERWKELYTTDALLKEEEWTDAYAFDIVRKQYLIDNKESLFFNLSAGIAGRDVFDTSLAGKYMTHLKGARKQEVMTVVPQAQQQSQHINQLSGKKVSLNDMKILTQNCVDGEVIKKNVSANLQLIENWLPICKPLDEEIVVCSAGPSLSADEILPWHEKGVKIVAVKHALAKLKKEKIVPWACILLDPREHVGDFVKKPDKRINYFVASMVDPSVTRHLLENGCKVFGYHAAVGAGEIERIPYGHLVIEGGSATSTRGLSLLEMLGFRKMHLYGYDCCYIEKPDLNDKKTNGKLRYEEVTLTSETWGGENISRTIWTEGQFLAQIQEMKRLYFPKPSLDLSIYGDGMIAWMYRHHKKYDNWCKKMRQESRAVYEQSTFDINGVVDGISKPS